MSRKSISPRYRLLSGACILAASALTSHAVTDKVFDFNSDPSGVLNTYGNAEWRPTDGNPAAGGYLAITDAVNSQGGIIVFDDFDNGLVVKGFNFKVDLRVGNPTGNDGRPADGFSVNFARENDPIVVKATNGETPDGFGDSAGAHEFGTRTGIAVSFDTWSGNALPDGPDVEGVIVRVDNATVTRVPMPTRNGACADPTSLQTGPYNAELSGAVDELCWQQLEVDLNDAAQLSVKWKGTTLLDKYQTSFLPSRGRIVFMGRTGGANQNNHIDNVRITTLPASTATVSGLTPRINGFEVKIEDAPGSVVSAASVAAKLNGATVPVTATKQGGTTTVTYAAPAGGRFVSGSPQSVELTFRDGANNSFTESRNFNAPVYGAFLSSTKVTDANTSQRGFRIRPHQVDGGQPNTIAWTEDQLAGRNGPNRVNLPLSGITADAAGFIAWDKAIDFKNASGGSGAFPLDYGFDQVGIPGFNEDGSQKANEDNSALEILGFIEFPTAGIVTMNVASDDGFRLQTGPDARDVFAQRLGQFDAGRGVDTGTTFDVWVEEPGIYPFRLVWENGGGGAGVEWTTISADGTRHLVGDPDNASALKTYRTRTSSASYVSSVRPAIDGTLIHAQPDITVVLENAGAIDAASVQLALNGTALTPTRTTAGSQLTVTAPTSQALPSASTNTVRLTYTPTGAAPIVREWSFRVIPYSNTLPASFAGDLASAADPGFRVRTWQIDPASDQTDPALRTANELNYAEAILAGIAGPNVANTANFTDSGYYIETATINYAQQGADGNPEAAGNFNPNRLIPGIPGNGSANNDSIAMEVLTYLALPNAGFYMLGVNSDDGFKVTPGHTAGTLPLRILAPANIAGAIAAVPSVRGDNQGGGIFAPLPATPIEAEIVHAQGNSTTAPADQGCGTALANAAAVAGKIAIVSRGTCTFLEKARNAANAGAIALIVYNNRSDPPIVLGGDANTLTIPVLMISRDDAAKINAASSVRASIGADPALVLGSFNAGRGASDTLFGFQVTQPGAYPVRLVWFEGGGGANVEWFSVNSDGSRTLLNEANNAKAIKTFRKATVVARPTLAAQRTATGMTLAYQGTLQSASSATGPYTDVAGAPVNGPFTVPTTGAAQFYRARN